MLIKIDNFTCGRISDLLKQLNDNNSIPHFLEQIEVNETRISYRKIIIDLTCNTRYRPQ